MASPQKENGFTPIANEILDKLVNISLLGSEYQILFFIIRKTYGYQKKEDRISLTQFEKGTGLSRPTVVKTIKNLMARNMVVKIYLPDENKGYSFVKDHEKWVVKTHLLVKGKWQSSKDVLTENSKDVLTHKRKKEITKEILGEETSQDNFNKEIREIIDLFGLFNKNNISWFKNKTQREDIRWMLENYSLEKVKKAIYLTSFCFTDSFYPSIGSPHELREKWVKMKKYWQGKEITDKRFIQDFDKYMIDKEKAKNSDKDKTIIEKTIMGRKVTYKINN